jgi:hypothetical protein
MTWGTYPLQFGSKLEIDWAGGNWVDESANLISASGRMQLMPLWQTVQGSAPQVWTATFELSNQSDRYSWFNSSSPIYANISSDAGYRKEIRFYVHDENPNNTTQIFAGRIDNMSIVSTAKDRIRITAVDYMADLLQDKRNTAMYTDQTTDAWITVLKDLGSVALIDLDAGLKTIPYAWLDQENLASEMQKAAAAEGGLLFFSRTGYLTFLNAVSQATVATYTTSQHTFTVSVLKDLEVRFEWKNVYNGVNVEASPRAPGAAYVVYSLPEAFTLMPSEVRLMIARYRKPTTAITTPVANTDFFITDGSGSDLTGSVTVSLANYAQRSEITFTNNASTTAIVRKFDITGIPLIGRPSEEVLEQTTDGILGDPAGAGITKTFPVKGNEYIQKRAQAAFVAEILAPRLKNGLTTYRIRDYPAHPTFVPGWRMTVVEADSGVNREAFITGISWRVDAKRYRADYDLIDATGWFSHSDYFEIGVSTLGSPSDKVFF